MEVWGSLLLLVVAFGGLALLLAAYTRRIFKRALTDQFRAAEDLTSGQLPKRWVTEIDRQVALGRRVPFMATRKTGTELLLSRLDKLSEFFQNGPFYDSPDAKHLLLGRLEAVRDRWADLSWDAIKAEQGLRKTTYE